MSEVQLLSNTTLPSILPLDGAAKALGLDAETLLRMVQSGHIIAFRDPNGEVFIPMNDGQPLQSAAVTEPGRNGSRNGYAHDEPGDINARLSKIRREDFAHLEEVPITVSEAAQKYQVPRHAIYRWIRRGYIRVLQEVSGGRGKALKIINEADVAICSAVYKIRKHYNSLAPLLNSDGEPYLLKYPELSKKRRA